MGPVIATDPRQSLQQLSTLAGVSGTQSNLADIIEGGTGWLWLLLSLQLNLGGIPS